MTSDHHPHFMAYGGFKSDLLKFTLVLLELHLTCQATLDHGEAKSLVVDWLRQDLVHSVGETLPDVLLLRIACHCANDWLVLNFKTELVEIELADPLSALETVHEGHVAVHQDEAELGISSFLLQLDILLDDLKGLLSV